MRARPVALVALALVLALLVLGRWGGPSSPPPAAPAPRPRAAAPVARPVAPLPVPSAPSSPPAPRRLVTGADVLADPAAAFAPATAREERVVFDLALDVLGEDTAPERVSTTCDPTGRRCLARAPTRSVPLPEDLSAAASAAAEARAEAGSAFAVVSVRVLPQPAGGSVVELTFERDGGD